MKILIVSPLGFAINAQTKYAGIEVLVWNYSQELSKNHDVSVLGHADSIFPDKVQLLPYKPQGNFDAELGQYQQYQSILRQFDVIHDFSHLHLASRFNPNLPSLNLFWHAPNEFQYPKAPYNIIGLSKWACREFKKAYHQEAKYQQSIALDTNLYKTSDRHRNDRFLCVGRMGAEKGNLEAALLCKELGVPLDIITASETKTGEISDYAKEVMAIADDKQIKIWWEKDYTTESKIKMMQTNKALLYVTNRPEVTTHKGYEALLCGMPVIVPGIGACPEWVTQGVDGYLCRTKSEYIEAMTNVNRLDPMKTLDANIVKLSISNVVKNNIPLYQEVANGLRW